MLFLVVLSTSLVLAYSKNLDKLLEQYADVDKPNFIVSLPKEHNVQEKEILELKQKLSKTKKAFIFISDSIDINQFENFNIDCWINTACLGLSFNNPNIINYSELPAI